MKTKAVIWDLGNVVFDVSFDRVFQSWGKACGQDIEKIKKGFSFNELFNQFERNEISATDFRISVCQAINIKLTDEDFDEGWCDLYMEVRDEMDKLLPALKNRYKLVALTNTNIIHNKVWRVKYAAILKYFDKIFSSHEMLVRKPEEQAYKIVLDYLRCEPEEVVFLDDNIDNIEGAQKLGIKSILVTSQQQMKKELQLLGVI